LLEELRMQNYFTDKRSMVEINKIIDFCEKLILKDQEKADAEETMESSTRAYELTRAVLRADNLTNYEVTKSDVIEACHPKYSFESITSIRESNISDTEKEMLLDRLLELKRFQVYTDYMRKGEYNSYYKKIYDSSISDKEEIITDLDSFIDNKNLPFFVAARQYQNFSILYHKDGILSLVEVLKFKECYNHCLNYFMKVCYNKAYKIDNPNYDNLCKLVIIFMAIERFLNSRMENIDDIDFFDEYSIRNLFLSYGLDYFFDFPLNYQKRILKNINFLIKNKGTTKAIINVLDIFGFENIKVMKYFLCKDYEKDAAGNILVDKPKLYFYGIDSEIENIEEGLQDKNTLKYEYEDFIKDDKYWCISSDPKKNENYDGYLQLLNDSFNYIYSKYISVESFMSLTKFGIDFSNFANLLLHIEEKYKNTDGLGLDKLHFYNYNISPKKISLLDAVLCLYSLTMKKYHYVDNIVKAPSAIARVYGFNYNDLLDDVYNFTTKYLLTNTCTLFELLDGGMKNAIRQQYSVFLIDNKKTKEEYSFDKYLAEQFDNQINKKYDFYHILPRESKGLIDKETGNRIIDSQEVINTEYNAYLKVLEKTLEDAGNTKEYILEELQKYTLQNYIDEFVSKEITDNYQNKASDYIIKIYLDNNEKEFNKFLKRYNLDKNTVLINYYVQQYINLNLSKDEFEKIKNDHPDLIDIINKEDSIKTILDKYEWFKKYPYFTEIDFINGIKPYLLEEFIEIENIKLYARNFLEGKIDLVTLELFANQFKELANNYKNEVEDYLNNPNELKLNNLKNSIPFNMSYRTVLGHYFATKYLNSIKEEKDRNDFKERYNLNKPLIIGLCDEFYKNPNNKNITVIEHFKEKLQERKLVFADIYFKYLTYKFLNDKLSSNIEENKKLYEMYIKIYGFSNIVLLDEIEYYRNWNKEGLISKQELNEYLRNFDVSPTYDFYTLRGIENPDTIKYLSNNVIQNYKDEHLKYIDRDKNMDQITFVETFKTNNKFRKELENAIMDTKDYKTFRYYQALYYCCCTSNSRYELFGDKKTFYEYLKDKDPNVAAYIDKLEAAVAGTPADRELIFNEYILELCNSIETYLDDEEFNFIVQGNTVLNDYIKELVFQLVDFIKSYTIQLRDLNTVLLFDDKFMNTLFIHEELAFKNQDAIADLENLLDVVQKLNNLGYVDVIPTLQDLLRLESILNIRSSELLSISDIAIAFQNMDLARGLYVLLDELHSNTELGYVSIIPKLLDILTNKQELTLVDLDFIKYHLQEILDKYNSNKIADLIAITDEVSTNNTNGSFSKLRFKDTLEAIITLNNGLDSKIYVTF